MSNSSGQTLEFFPVDLVVTGLLGLWTVVVAFAGLGGFPGRTALGLVAILFAPGYAFVSALFPQQNSETGFFEDVRAEGTGNDGRVSVVERVLLAVVLSVCTIPLLGLGLDFAQVEIQTAAFLGTVGAATLVLTIIASIRRYRTLPWERFDPEVGGFLRTLPGQLRSVQARSNLTLLLIIGFVIAGAGIGVAVLDAERGEQFTEFSLLSEDPETGELVAEGYPEEIPRGESETIHVGITNNEGETLEYSVVTVVQSIDDSGQIQEVETVDEFTVTVQDGETWREPHSLSPTMTGEELRVTYLLYIGSPPENETPTAQNSYRSVHIWVDVPPSG